MASSQSAFIRKNNIIAFKGRKHVLSNFYPCSFIYKGYWFNCGEQAYQWEKAIFHYRLNIAEYILKLKDPYAQKICTKSLVIDEEWLTKRVFYMKQILIAKSEFVPEYKHLLLHSKGVLVEATANERFWSCGLNKSAVYQCKQSDWHGENMLGKLHMELREELQSVCTLLITREKQMKHNLHFEPNRSVTDIIIDRENIVVIVYARDVTQAYEFTDSFLVPRKVVRIIIGEDCHSL